MNKTFINCLVAILFGFISQSVLAGDYLGFNLCQLTDEESVKKIVEDAGGEWVGNGQAKNYPIAVGRYEISTNFYDGKLYSINVENPTGLYELLTKKYKTISDKEIGRTAQFIAHELRYAVKGDSNIEIELVVSLLIPSASINENSLSYTCKDINKKRLADEKRVNARDHEESIKQRNTGKSL